MLDGCLGVVVGDVSSHGMGPALLMSETRACLRTLAQSHSDVGEILTRANRMLAGRHHDFHFVTLAMARLDPRDRAMVYASAGQRGYLLARGRRRRRCWTARACRWASTPRRWCAAAPPLIAAARRHADLLHRRPGRGRVARPGAFRRRPGLGGDSQRARQAGEQIIKTLREEMLGFCRQQPQQDDITIVIVKTLE